MPPDHAPPAPANTSRLVTVFGGSGFIGRYVVQALVRQGFRLRVLVRRPNLALFLRPLGEVGQIELRPGDIRDPDACAAALDGAWGAVNLVGILHESGGRRFADMHVRAPAALAAAAAAADVRLVHVSAIGASAGSTSAYARSRAAGEAEVLAHAPGATILRPSVVFGPEDDFFNRFAAMARLSPFLPLIGGGRTRLQPVCVRDVAQAVVQTLQRRDATGRIFELGGPGVYSFGDLMAFILAVTGRRRILLPIPFALARALGLAVQWLPAPPLTADQVEMLKTDNVVSAAARADGRDLPGLGIAPLPLEAETPAYLARFRRQGEFTPPPPEWQARSAAPPTAPDDRG